MDDYSYLFPKDTTNYSLIWSLAALLIVVIMCLVYLFRYAKTERREDMVNWRKRIGWPLCEVLSLCVTVLSLYMGRELSKFQFFLSIFFFFIGTISLILFIFCYSYFEKLNDNAHKRAVAKEIACKQSKCKEIFDRKLADLDIKYGEHTAIINCGKWYDINDQIIIFEITQIVIIKLMEYHFSDILGYSLIDDVTSETITTSTGTAKTSTGSMLRRAAVGGVLTGGLGAVAGAATAKKDISDNATSQTTTKHNYTLYINVNSLQEPTIALKIGNYALKAKKLAGVINAIVERNKQTTQ